jgi:hypothetical protein
LIVESPVRTIETDIHTTEIALSQANKKQKPAFLASTSVGCSAGSLSALISDQKRGWRDRSLHIWGPTCLELWFRQRVDM